MQGHLGGVRLDLAHLDFHHLCLLGLGSQELVGVNQAGPQEAGACLAGVCLAGHMAEKGMQMPGVGVAARVEGEAEDPGLCRCPCRQRLCSRAARLLWLH